MKQTGKQNIKGAKLRDLAPWDNQTRGAFSRYDEFFNLLLNAVSIVKKTGESMDYNEEMFAKKALFETGKVGFDKITGTFRYVFGEGVNELGNPTTLRMITANGKAYTRVASYDDKEDGAYIIYATPNGASMSELIRRTTDFMTVCDVGMMQNIEACKTPYVLVCKNDEMLLSFKQAIHQKQQGQAVVLVSEELGEGMKSVNIGVPFLADKFAMVRDTERDALLNKLGILTANTDKRERVQTAEVTATIGVSSDYIYMLIDTFNKQMETYGIEYRMFLNGALEELYEAENGEAQDLSTMDDDQSAQAMRKEENND